MRQSGTPDADVADLLAEEHGQRPPGAALSRSAVNAYCEASTRAWARNRGRARKRRALATAVSSRTKPHSTMSSSVCSIRSMVALRPRRFAVGGLDPAPAQIQLPGELQPRLGLGIRRRRGRLLELRARGAQEVVDLPGGHRREAGLLQRSRCRVTEHRDPEQDQSAQHTLVQAVRLVVLGQLERERRVQPGTDDQRTDS